MSQRLRTEFLGMEVENPWCVASAPPAATGKLMADAFDAGWGAAIMKTVGPIEEPIINVAPRIQTMKKWNREIAMQNIELITDRRLSVWLEELRTLRKRYPKKMIIGSIMAPGHDMDAWAKLIEAMNSVGCDAVELNLGCPHGMPERDMGAVCSQDAEIVHNIVSTAKSASKVPILTKLTPNVTNIKAMAQAAKRGGTDAITVINTVNGIIGIDIYKRKPHLSVNGYTAIGGISGNAVKPMGLKCVAECKQATGLPISATGGIATWSDGVEYLLMGAEQLQVCTEIMIRGFKIVSGLNKGLESYLDQMGYQTIDQAKGDLYKNVTSFEFLLNHSSSEKVQVNEETCTGCNLCVVACDDAGYDALKLKEVADLKRTQGTRKVAEVLLDQ
ncbi:NAD-dependent dihydropyrimidine dehydrogenase subunit PreA, partial [bacterium]|nr:NAD-dependent dihydropyrimidine dehydrogenase subunit PreA [bacterium]